MIICFQFLIIIYREKDDLSCRTALLEDPGSLLKSMTVVSARVATRGKVPLEQKGRPCKLYIEFWNFQVVFNSAVDLEGD